EPVDACAVEPEDLRFCLGRDRRIAIAVLEFRGDLEAAERLDLILRTAVPDAVGAPADSLLSEMLQQLAHEVSGLVGLRHVVAPDAAELGVEITFVRPEAVLVVRADQAVDALVVLRVVGTLDDARFEAGVIADESDVGISGGDPCDVAGLRVLVLEARQRETPVGGDDGQAQLSSALDESDSYRIVHVIPGAVRSPLRVELPGGNAMNPHLLLHPLQPARLVRHDATVDEAAIAALRLLGDRPRLRRIVGGRRIAAVGTPEGGNDRCVGIAVEIDLLQELPGGVAVIAFLAVGGLAEDLEQVPAPALAVAAGGPVAGRIDAVGLDVEDDLLLPQLRLGELIVEGRVAAEVEEAAAGAQRGVRLVQREQRRRGSSG